MSILIADFGGTNARLALSTPTGISQILNYQCEAFADPASVINVYCHTIGLTPDRGILAVAGNGGQPEKVIFSNGPWRQRDLDFTQSVVGTVETINDFAANVYAVSLLEEYDYKTLIPGNVSAISHHLDGSIAVPQPSRDIAPEQRFIVAGPGTGLGVGSGLRRHDGVIDVLGGEGGHGGFEPSTMEQLRLAQFLRGETGAKVTYETICSGPGLVRTFNGLAQMHGNDCRVANPAELVKFKLSGGTDKRLIANQTLSLFSKTLGDCAANAALVLNAREIYIAGGIIPKLGEHFDLAAFTTALHDNDLGKGNYMKDIPVRLITHDNPGLLGCHARAQSLALS